MKVGIIIVTYNSQKDIGRLLDSIIIQNYNNLEVYVVDNNSADQTLDIIRTYQSKISIQIIFSRVNHGFARGNNIGIKRAIEDGCEYVFILNPDIELEEKCIDILTKRIESDEKIGAIGPIVLYGNEPENVIQAYGVNANFRTQKKVGPFGNEKWTVNLPAEIYVDFVLGGAMMIRSSVLKITGLFEEDYFMYNDELDLAYRIKKAGFKTVCVRDAIVRHFHDFGNQNKTGYNIMYYYVIRNRYLYFKKFRFYFNLAFSLLAELLNIPLKIVWAIRRMHNINVLKFYYSGLIDGLLGKKGIAYKAFNSTKKVKEIILTIDYELFLGKETGNVKDVIIEPTQKILSILEKNDSRMTVFWDILHFYRLLGLEKNHPALKEDRLLIENQILDLASKGHDIQLHLHPHWLDAKYENNRWIFNYQRFKLHNLSIENKKDDINTIAGCICIAKALMENIIRKVKPDYKVTTFRAGGYLIEPFDKLRNVLLSNGIRTDSSVCPNLENDNGVFSFNFNSYPVKQYYYFENTPKEITGLGSFIEIPVTTLKIPAFINIYFTFLRKLKYPSLESERKGRGVGEYFKDVKPSYLKRIISLTHSRFRQFSTDSSFNELFTYEYNRVPLYSTMILHPKLLNSHTLRILDDYVSTNKVCFISIKDFIK
ncbi:MAG TPA: glycosyltransferase [Ignavibacteriaceae bacterium]|nr:glycosyltransferase [Ignavibacteriaceae bacterium]